MKAMKISALDKAVLRELAQRLARGRAIYIEHNWNAEEKRFVNLVANLVDRKLTAPTA